MLHIPYRSNATSQNRASSFFVLGDIRRIQAQMTEGQFADDTSATSFKAEQRLFMEAVYNGHVFVWLPTGYGKSLCYQTLPTSSSLVPRPSTREELGTRLLQALAQGDLIFSHRLKPAHLFTSCSTQLCGFADSVYKAFHCVEGLGTRLHQSCVYFEKKGMPV